MVAVHNKKNNVFIGKRVINVFLTLKNLREYNVLRRFLPFLLL
jgi:hypothetical protein